MATIPHASRFHFLSTDLISGNVHLFKWLPQTDLLYHPKARAFITHAGYNSVQEAIHAGIPMVCLALFGDQPKNAKVTEKLGISRNLKKTELTAEAIEAAIRDVLENERYNKNAKKLARMVQRKPVSPSDLLVRWTEFLAEFKTLDNLKPAGNKLNWIQYHSIDVLLFLASLVSLVIFIFIKILKFVAMKFCRCLKHKEKQKQI
ncbi:hypothetical protein Y032_0552g3345 [Ancylostoma ceylanicum]|uniref:UDP-glucuronosyltransferase n=1 Tax=Ancylostoma ceylanicum TaxID=53326 RepID=A0A016WS84_9BILA|nr:hypothetical protein Y032_0552g3345 [Ancylostoma ceylanicum]